MSLLQCSCPTKKAYFAATWANGFVRGMKKEEWAALFNDENYGVHLPPSCLPRHVDDQFLIDFDMLPIFMAR
jgi:hypothetical protein